MEQRTDTFHKDRCPSHNYACREDNIENIKSEDRRLTRHHEQAGDDSQSDKQGPAQGWLIPHKGHEAHQTTLLNGNGRGLLVGINNPIAQLLNPCRNIIEGHITGHIHCFCRETDGDLVDTRHLTNSVLDGHGTAAAIHPCDAKPVRNRFNIDVSFSLYGSLGHSDRAPFPQVIQREQDHAP